MDEREISFDEVVDLLTQACGTLVTVSIAMSPAGHEGRAVVADFGGTLEDLIEGIRPDEIVLRLRLGARDDGGLGTVALKRSTFQRAAVQDDDLPVQVSVWQRGIKVSLELYGAPPAEGATDTRDDEAPF